MRRMKNVIPKKDNLLGNLLFTLGGIPRFSKGESLHPIHSVRRAYKGEMASRILSIPNTGIVQAPCTLTPTTLTLEAAKEMMDVSHTNKLMVKLTMKSPHIRCYETTYRNGTTRRTSGYWAARVCDRQIAEASEQITFMSEIANYITLDDVTKRKRCVIFAITIAFDGGYDTFDVTLSKGTITKVIATHCFGGGEQKVCLRGDDPLPLMCECGCALSGFEGKCTRWSVPLEACVFAFDEELRKQARRLSHR